MWNLLDDRLACDADAAGEVTKPLRNRMVNLIGHGVDGHADAVLMACSMYGSAKAFAANLWSIPVFTSDGDMMDAIAAARPRRIAILASLQASAVDSQARLAAHLTDAENPSDVLGCSAPAPLPPLRPWDQGGLVKALADGIDSTGGEFDALCIAQYSLSPARRRDWPGSPESRCSVRRVLPPPPFVRRLDPQ